VADRSAYRVWAPEPGSYGTLRWDLYRNTVDHFSQLEELSIDEESFFVHWKMLEKREAQDGNADEDAPFPSHVYTSYSPRFWSNIVPQGLKRFILLMKCGPSCVSAIIKLKDCILKGLMPHLEEVLFLVSPVDISVTPCTALPQYKDEFAVIGSFAKELHNKGFSLVVQVIALRLVPAR
jgi:hypothetical protein